VKILKAALSKTKTVILKTFDLRDIFSFGGTGFLSFGVWQVYPPAAFIVAGSIFLWLGIRRVK